MKKDSALVIKILEFVESSPKPNGTEDVIPQIPGYSQEVVASHVRLMDDDGLIRAIDLSDLDEYDWRVRDITAAGHDRLNASRQTRVGG